MTATVKIPHSLINPLENSYNSQLGVLAAYAAYSGANSSTETIDGIDLTVFENISSKRIPITIAQLVISVGGDVRNYQTFLPVEDITAEVTVGLPDRISIDENGNEIVKTWSEWANGEPQEIDGKFYIEMGNGNRYYYMSELAPVITNLITAKSYNSLIPSSDV